MDDVVDGSGVAGRYRGGGGFVQSRDSIARVISMRLRLGLSLSLSQCGSKC